MIGKKPTYEELEQRIRELESGIEKRKQALAEKTTLLDNILQNAQDVAIATTDLDFRINYYNPMAEKLYGYTAEEVLGKTVQEMHTKEKIKSERFERAVEIVRSKGRYCYSVTQETGDGPRYLDSQVAGIFNPDGKMVGFSLFSRDVTKRKQAEEALIAEHERFVVAMDSFDAGVYAVDMETHELLFANQYIRKEFGDIVGKTCWKTIQAGQTGPCNFCTNNKLLDADGKPTGPYVWEFQNTIDGEWYQCRDQAILWPDGRLARLEIAGNITGRKQTETTLRKRERYLAGLNEAAQVLLANADVVPFQGFVDKIGPALDASRAYVFINHHDPDGNLLMSQKAEWCAEGITPEIDNPLLQSLSYDAWFLRWQNVLAHGDILSGLVSGFPAEERKILDPQNILAILIIPIMIDGEFVGFVGFDNCVSEHEWGIVEQTFIGTATTGGLAQAIKRGQMEARLRQAQKMEAIGVLAGGIAHQFNNDLSTITGYTDLLEMDFSGDEKVVNYTKKMKASASHMTQLTTQLLAYARGGKYQAKTVSLGNFVRTTLPLIRYTINPAIHVETDLPHNIFNVKADLTQMQMVLSAVLINASEAMDGKGCIRIACRNIMITDETVKDFPGLKPGNYVNLMITDDGKGMDKETKKRIFEPFFTTNFQGRGLGMAAVYGIVKNHAGWILVDSEPGRGTIIKIYLPATRAQMQEPKKPKAERIKGAGTILVIEDEEMVLIVCRAMLERLGYRVLEAQTGQEAINIVKTFDGDIDLAMLDILLPDISGNAVYPLLMKTRPDLKVIVTSGYSIDGPAEEIIDAGAQDFLQKPFMLAALSEKLKKVLEGE